MEEYPYFPIFINLSEKKVVVIGAGNIAKRRIQVLSEFTRHLTVVAPVVHPDVEGLAKSGAIQLLRKKYEAEDIYGAALVLAATNDRKVNHEIYEICKKQGIPVNVCDDREKCDFYFPGIVRKDEVVVGVTASGKDHGRARRVTEVVRAALETL